MVKHSDIISSIRAPLVIMVLVMHLFLTYSYETLYQVSVAISLVGRGDIAVSGFFVLSGYLLTRKWVGGEVSPLAMILERLARLMIPFFVAYALLVIVFDFGAGAFGVNASSMGYQWGYRVPIGMLTNLQWGDAWQSLLGQLSGTNDNLILTAWTMWYELQLIGFLICIIMVTRCAEGVLDRGAFKDKRGSFLLFCLGWILVCYLLRSGDGLIEAAALGSVLGFVATHSRWSADLSLFAKKQWKILSISWLPLMAVLLSLATVRFLASESFYIEYGVALKDSSFGMWVMYLLVDKKYLIYALLAVLLVPVFLLLAKANAVRVFARYVALTAYSTYLIHTHVLMLHSKILTMIPMTLPIPVVVATFVALLVPCVALFYYLVERPCWRLGKLLEKKIDAQGVADGYYA